jgi:hypothetical protein
MTGLLAQVPNKLLWGAIAGVALLAVVTVVLAWHGLRRLFDLPRVPKPRAMYFVLVGSWLALVTVCSAAIGAIALLRDYRHVDLPTQLAEVRCAVADLDRLELELRPPSSPTPERYDVAGDKCIVWVKQVELRPGLGGLGLRALSRVEGVGPIVRPAANPGWLTPEPQRARRLVDLFVRNTTTVPIAVPLDQRARMVLVSSPTGPTLQPGPI